MLKLNRLQFVVSLLTLAILMCANGPASAAVRIEGQVQAGGGAVANSTVTLWAASAGSPDSSLRQQPTAMVDLS